MAGFWESVSKAGSKQYKLTPARRAALRRAQLAAYRKAQAKANKNRNKSGRSEANEIAIMQHGGPGGGKNASRGGDYKGKKGGKTSYRKKR